MKEMGIHFLLALSAEDAKRKTLCLIKRQELLNNGIPPSELKVRNFELFMNDKNVELEDIQSAETA